MSKGSFTLVEVVVGTALLIMAFALFLGSFVSAKRSAVISDNRMDAVHNARMAMETFLSYPYASTQLNTGARTSVISGVTNYCYIVIVTQDPGIVVKNIYVTNRWVNPVTRMTSTVSLAVSMSEEFHK